MILFGKKKVKPSQKAYAVVTGAGSGIGRSFAIELAKRGGSVVCADINLEAAEETVTLIINNAGVGLGGKFDEMSLEDWKWCMHVNLWGVIHGCHAFVPKFKKLGYGAIINVASAASYTAAPEMTAYNVTKAGVRALSETLSAELRKFNIKVNVLCPTLVPTNIIKNGRIPGRYSKLADHALMNYALTTSDDVAKLTLNRLDQDELYTIPQIDAKLFWLMKRASPSLYTKFLGTSYKLFK
ncbi:2,3-dihydroxybenzoate-2,3-dehydrogenase [Acinetobacter baumannii]|uniref:SDR family NAD(P)-dependent oxidoreductase n=1 Tax=Acinetobacter baumannii TaxID=470 RepID=UPI00135F7981|nr:SDR family NAD(P)-dependent oxidoreductase [Acinetobacter baumannii]CAA0153821.1 2,3-dihydroxybenzoate-2,3-dehydrogenase [Acinetobacter baumannii]